MKSLTYDWTRMLPNRRFSILMGLASIYLAWGSPVLLVAQNESQPTATDKPRPAVIAFQAEPSRILDSNFAKSLQLENSFRYDPQAAQLWKAKSLKGLVSLPDDVQAFIAPQPGGATPFHYYFEFEMSSDQHIRDLKEVLGQRMSPPEERGGVIYYYPRYETDAYVAVTKERRVIMASGSYPYDPRRFPTLTATAERLLKETQKAAAGVAIDVKGAERFIESAVDFGQEALPPPAKAYLTLPEKIVWAKGDFVLVPQAEVRVVIESVDTDAAAEILETAQGLVALAKFSLNGNDPNIQAQRKLLETIKSRTEGKQVILTAVLPTDVLAKLQEQSEEMRVMNDVRQMSLSMHNYESAYGQLPFHALPGQSEDLSWQVRVLPFIEQGALYEQFDLSQPWDSPVNRPLLDQMPQVLGEGNQTSLRWVQSDVRRFGEMTDGTSNTIAFIHNGPPVPWTANQPLTHNDAVRMFLALKPGETMIVGMYDGSVRRLSADTPIETFEALLTPAGGEVVDPIR